MDQLAEGTLLPPILAGRKALVVGVANVRAMAWVCSKALQRAGAENAMTYLNGKARPYVEPWARALVFQFPSDWLPDRGRAITSRTANWPEHLDGFSNRAYAYSAQDLKPRGFLLHAGILDWPGGKPGDVGDRRHSGGGLPPNTLRYTGSVGAARRPGMDRTSPTCEARLACGADRRSWLQRKAASMLKSRIAAATVIVATVAGCDKPAPPASQARLVRTVTVERGAEGETVSLTGQVRAREQVSFAFRLDGRMIKRPVNVSDVLTAGQVVAQLDPQNQQNALRSAQASLASAEAVLTQARLTFGRQQQLVEGGWTPRAKFDEAQQNLLTAQAQVDSAHAQVGSAQDQLSYTVLFADAPGVVTATGAEPGEVVRAGQMIVNVARQGGRDAVFDVSEQLIRTGPRDPVVQIALTNDPTVRATGRVREVSPQADPATRTFQVKVGIIDPPQAMELGSTVTGSIKLSALHGVEVPPSALTEANGRPAVWVVDPQSQTVSLRNVDVSHYDPASVVVPQGLETGEIVVTAGVQTLHPGQKVRLLGAAL